MPDKSGKLGIFDLQEHIFGKGDPEPAGPKKLGIFDLEEAIRGPSSKKGSDTVPKMAGGGKVVKSWGK